MYKAKAIEEMQQVFGDAPFGVDHTLKVLGYAEEIMEGENVPSNDRELIAIAAILHDIGALEAQRKHGTMAAPYQEIEGAVIARQILEKIGYSVEETNRVCYIVGHHHTAAKIDGLDFQIIWEADLLVNLAGREVRHDREKLVKTIEDNFQTKTGKEIAEKVYLFEK